jgi:hypothetical protein
MSVLFVSHVINTNRDLLDCFGSSDVKLLTKSGEIKQIPSVAPLLPTGKDKKVLTFFYLYMAVQMLTC